MASRTRVPTKVSGEHVFVESGVRVIVPALDVKVSGSIVEISGQHVYVESGTHVVVESGVGVLISGQHVFVESGVNIVGAFTANVSGQPVTVSGDIVQISGQHVFVESGVYIIGSFTANVSGQPVTISGNHVFVESGVYIIGAVAVAGLVAINSGQVSISSGEVHIVSGSVTANVYTPSRIKISGSLMKVTSDSGGANLPSGAIISVTVKSLSWNSGEIMVGGSTHRPNSGVGFLLEPGEAIGLDVDNLGEVLVWARNSGDYITFAGVT